MNAVEIYEKASWDLEHSKINLGEFEERIRTLYDVEPVRHGRWIGKTYKCSLCGKWIDPLQGDADMNYCPNCGAKMDKKEQEHDKK